MLLSQYRTTDGSIQLVARDGTQACNVATDLSLYDLAMDCAATGTSLRDRVGQLGMSDVVDLEAIYVTATVPSRSRAYLSDRYWPDASGQRLYPVGDA